MGENDEQTWFSLLTAMTLTCIGIYFALLRERNPPEYHFYSLEKTLHSSMRIACAKTFSSHCCKVEQIMYSSYPLQFHISGEVHDREGGLIQNFGYEGRGLSERGP